MFFISRLFPFLDCNVSVGFLWEILMIPAEMEVIFWIQTNRFLLLFVYLLSLFGCWEKVEKGKGIDIFCLWCFTIWVLKEQGQWKMNIRFLILCSVVFLGDNQIASNPYELVLDWNSYIARVLQNFFKRKIEERILLTKESNFSRPFVLHPIALILSYNSRL